MPELSDLPGIERATILDRDQHSISRKNISPNALKVLRRLHDTGHSGFLVGGGVRDLLLGKHPKDFDIATDATPEELRKLFRNARIIGRRFKIVHIRFGREIIEVTTFRAQHESSQEVASGSSRKQIKGLDSAHTSDGMLVRDNVYGNIDDDALRRDFTVNALYYTTDGFKLLDFCTGLDDLKSRKIRMIGDPPTRYREDPVRMLRALRFAAKLGFEIDRATEAPIEELADLLQSISPARMFDEVLKLLSSGYGVATFSRLQQSRLGLYTIGPTLEALTHAPGPASNLVSLALRNTDARIAQGKSVTPYFLFAALLWPVVQLRLSQRAAAAGDQGPGLMSIASDVISEQQIYTAIPRRISYSCREIWELQFKLEQRTRRNVNGTINHPRFRAAYDFLLLREESGEDLGKIGQWWTEFQFGDTKLRDQLIEQLPRAKRRKRRRRKSKSAGNSGD